MYISAGSFIASFQTLDFEKDKFTVKFANSGNSLEILQVGTGNRRTWMHINNARTIPIKKDFNRNFVQTLTCSKSRSFLLFSKFEQSSSHNFD